MAKQMAKFRAAFNFPKNNVNWFPGHMGKGVRVMQQKLAQVDCIIEVHDARHIPFSGRNPNFYHLLTAARPHILVLNKADLADASHQQTVEDLLRERMDENRVLFTDCHKGGSSEVKKIIPMAIDLIKSSTRINRAEMDLHIMVIGIPNVGKSSLINSLRALHLKRAKAAHVGSTPGITRAVMNKIKISDDPPLFLFDTPGVLQPNIKNMEVGLKLALCDTIQEGVVTIITKADFLLYWANKYEFFGYVEYLGLTEPTDDIYKVLFHIAHKNNQVIKLKNTEGKIVVRPDLDAASQLFVKAFQTGKIGKFLLDSDVVLKMDGRE